MKLLLYEMLMQNIISADQVSHADVISRFDDTLKRVTVSLKYSRTAAVWLQYIDMVDIRAERTGNWGLHSKLFQKCSLGFIWAQQLHEICLGLQKMELSKMNVEMCIDCSK